MPTPPDWLPVANEEVIRETLGQGIISRLSICIFQEVMRAKYQFAIDAGEHARVEVLLNTIAPQESRVDNLSH